MSAESNISPRVEIDDLLGEIARLARIGASPIGETSTEDLTWFASHELTQPEDFAPSTGRLFLGGVSLKGINEWLRRVESEHSSEA